MSVKRTLIGLPAALTTLAIFLGAIALILVRLRFQPYAKVRQWVREHIGDLTASLDFSLILIIAAVIGVMLVCRCRTARTSVAALGMSRPILPATLFAFIATLPMLVGYGLTGTATWNWSLVLQGAIIAAFVEEVFFRGFAYRMLHERAGWGFWPAAVFTGVVFGLMHVPLDNLLRLDLSANHLLTIALTAAGGVFYAWLYMRWKFNLWVPIFLHMFMNLWWMVFAAGDNAVGGMTANICRGLTIAAAVVLTLNAQRLPVLRRGMKG